MIIAMDAMGCPSVWLYVFFEFYFSAGDQPWKRQRVRLGIQPGTDVPGEG